MKDGIGGGARDGGRAARKGDAREKDLICGARLRSSLSIGCDAMSGPVLFKTVKTLVKIELIS